MAFDYKKEYREFYMPGNTPELIRVPPMNFIAVRGKGNSNEEGGAYKQSIGLLYGIAFTIKKTSMHPALAVENARLQCPVKVKFH